MYLLDAGLTVTEIHDFFALKNTLKEYQHRKKILPRSCGFMDLKKPFWKLPGLYLYMYVVFKFYNEKNDKY